MGVGRRQQPRRLSGRCAPASLAIQRFRHKSNLDTIPPASLCFEILSRAAQLCVDLSPTIHCRLPRALHLPYQGVCGLVTYSQADVRQFRKARMNISRRYSHPSSSSNDDVISSFLRHSPRHPNYLNPSSAAIIYPRSSNLWSS